MSWLELSTSAVALIGFNAMILLEPITRYYDVWGGFFLATSIFMLMEAIRD